MCNHVLLRQVSLCWPPAWMENDELVPTNRPLSRRRHPAATSDNPAELADASPPTLAVQRVDVEQLSIVDASVVRPPRAEQPSLVEQWSRPSADVFPLQIWEAYLYRRHPRIAIGKLSMRRFNRYLQNGC